MIAAIIQARMGSNRFPGKVLKDLNGKPVIQYIIENIYEIDYCLADIDMNNIVDLFDIMFLVNQIIS